jgi:hypothetical protein
MRLYIKIYINPPHLFYSYYFFNFIMKNKLNIKIYL